MSTDDNPSFCGRCGRARADHPAPGGDGMDADAPPLSLPPCPGPPGGWEPVTPDGLPAELRRVLHAAAYAADRTLAALHAAQLRARLLSAGPAIAERVPVLEHIAAASAALRDASANLAGAVRLLDVAPQELPS